MLHCVSGTRNKMAISCATNHSEGFKFRPITGSLRAHTVTAANAYLFFCVSSLVFFCFSCLVCIISNVQSFSESCVNPSCAQLAVVRSCAHTHTHQIIIIEKCGHYLCHLNTKSMAPVLTDWRLRLHVIRSTFMTCSYTHSGLYFITWTYCF